MGIKNFAQFGLTGILMCLLITICSVNLEAEERNQSDSVAMASPILTSLMEVAPRDSVLVLQIKDIDGLVARIEAASAWQKLIQAPMWEVFKATLEIETEIKEYHRLVGPSMSVPIHLLGREILLIVPEFQGLLEFSPALIIQMNRGDELGEILASTLEVTLANLPDSTRHEYNGWSYQVMAPIGPMNTRLSFGVFDDLLVVSWGDATLHKVIDLYQGKSKQSLANDVEFSQRIARFQATSTNRVTNFQMAFYLDLITIRDFVALTYPMVRGAIPQEKQLLVNEAIKWLDLVQSVTAVSNLTKDGLLSQSYIQFNPEASDKDLLTLIGVPPIEHDSIHWTPADSASYFSSNFVDPHRLWRLAMNLIKSMPSGNRQQIDSTLDAIQMQLGINIEEDLLSWMGNQIAMIHTGDFTAIPTEESQGGNGATTVPHLLLLIQTTDSAKASESLSALMDSVIGLLAQMTDTQIERQTIDYLGTQIHSMTIPDVPLQPGYAVTDQYVLVAIDTSNLKATLDCARGQTDNLSTTPLFAEIRSGTPEMVNSIGYIDPTRSIEKILTALLTTLLEDFPAQAADQTALMEHIRDRAVNSIKEVMKTLVGQIQYTVNDGAGLWGYSFLKIRDLNSGATHTDLSKANLLARSLLLAHGYTKKGLPTRAQSYLDRALRIADDLVEFGADEGKENGYDHRLAALAYVTSGGVFNAQGEPDEAIVAYKKAIRLDASLALAHAMLGDLYAGQDQLDQAIATYKVATRLDPENGGFHNNLAWYEAIGGQIEAAIADAETAVRLDPNSAAAHDTLGFAYKQQGNLEKAISAFQTAIRLDPSDEEGYYHYHLACVYALKREEAPAKKNLQVALARNRQWLEDLETNSDFDGLRERLELTGQID